LDLAIARPPGPGHSPELIALLEGLQRIGRPWLEGDTNVVARLEDRAALLRAASDVLGCVSGGIEQDEAQHWLACERTLEALRDRAGHFHVHGRVDRPPLAARPPPKDASSAKELVANDEMVDGIDIGVESALQGDHRSHGVQLGRHLTCREAKRRACLCKPRLTRELVSLALLGDLAQSLGVTGRIDDLEGLVRGHGHVQALALPGHGADTKHVDGCHGNVGPGWRPKKATKLMSNALMKHPSRYRTGKKKSNGAERLDVTRAAVHPSSSSRTATTS